MQGKTRRVATVDSDSDVAISVIIPAHNAANTIGPQLKALSRQRQCDPFEVIVVDNRSSDATREVVSRWQGRLPRLHLILADEKLGAPYARNVGARHAVGEWLLFCDADDEVDAAWVSEMHKALAQCDFAGGAHELSKLNDSRWLVPGETLESQLAVSHDFLPYAGGANCGMRADAFEELGGFNEEYRSGGEEPDLFWKAQLAGYSLAFAPKAIVHYRQRPSAIAVFRQSFRWGAEDPHLFRDFRDYGMPGPSWRKFRGRWIGLLMTLPGVLEGPESRRRWMRRAGRGLGRIVGSVRWRTLYV